MVYFLFSLSMLRKRSLFQPQNMLRICLHIEKGLLAASYSKPMLFMSMKTNVAAWICLMITLAKHI